MRSLLALAIIGFVSMAAGRASAAACTSNANNNLYSTGSMCSAFAICGTAFCSCVGSTSSSVDACMGFRGNATCATVQTCLMTYQACIEGVPTTSSGCLSLNTNVRLAKLAASSSGYTNSRLQQSCRRRTCVIMNSSSTPCDFGEADANVCVFRPIAAATTMAASTTTAAGVTTTVPTATPTSAAPNTTAAANRTSPPVDTAANFVAAIVATLNIPGNDFGRIFSNATALVELKTGVQSDLSNLLSVDFRFVVILDMFVASLHVDFAVDASAGVEPSDLQSRVATGTTNANWLANVKAAYAQVSNETIVAPTIAVTQTAAPGLVTPVPPIVTNMTDSPGDISAAPTTGVVAAIAASLAAVASFAVL